MDEPPPVYFDLSISPHNPLIRFLNVLNKIYSIGTMLMVVLDPLVFGLIPESLLPVIGYACVIALLAWIVLGRIAVKLIRIGARRTGFREIHRAQKKLH